MALGTPAALWEFDEVLFAHAVAHYDPLAHHPPPPGYPVFIFVAQIVRRVAPSNFAALVSVNFAASAIGFVFLALAFGRIAGQAAGILAALLFYLSPSMLVHSTLAMSEPGAVALLAAALYFLPVSDSVCGPASAGRPAEAGPHTSPAAFGFFAALAVGWRPQFAIFVLPMLVASMFVARTWRDRAIALIVFTVVCVAWLIPLASAVGGLERLIPFERQQAMIVAAHDADVSRSGWTPATIARTFIVDPWGPALIAWPVLLAIGVGVTRVWRDPRAAPILIGGAAYLAFALAVMDPADSVRYAIPFMLAAALPAAMGIAHLRPNQTYAIAALFGAASIIYSSSLLVQRSTSMPPALMAARDIESRTTPDAVILYELPLWPHATYWLSGRRLFRPDDGLQRFFDSKAPMWLYADGDSDVSGSRQFSWAASDAYSALTRNHYRVVTTIPVPPERRFRPLAGVRAFEREVDGDEWRWLDQDAALQLPSLGATAVLLRLGLPQAAPFADNVVTVTSDRSPLGRVRVVRGGQTRVTLPLPAGASILRFHSDRAYRPAMVAGSLNRDPRRLGVRLHELVLQP